MAREKPHCGVSGVPFMNNTTGVVATALSMAALVSFDNSRSWRGVRMERRAIGMEDLIAIGRAIWRKACIYVSHCWGFERRECTEKAGLVIILKAFELPMGGGAFLLVKFELRVRKV